MKNYLFTLTNNKKEVKEIKEDHFYYEVYNDYLEKFYGTNINENEDFIAYIVPKNKILLVIKINDVSKFEDIKYNVFDLMQDYLYKIA